MEVKLWVVVVAISLAAAQEPDRDGNLADIKLFLREEKIPAIVNYLLEYGLETHQISTQDIVKLSKLDRYDLDNILQVLKFYQIEPADAFTVSKLRQVLTLFDIDISDFYVTYTNKLYLSEDQLDNILSTLKIPESFWKHTSRKDTERVYEDLASAELTPENIQRTLQIAQRTDNQVYTTARDVLGQTVQQLNSSVFMQKLKSQGWNFNSALTLYQALNLTPEDVYAVPKFRNIFTNITDSLNANKTLAVFVGPKEVVVHAESFEFLQESVDKAIVKVEADGIEVFLNNATRVGAHIYQLNTAQDRFIYLDIATNYTSSASCSYVTSPSTQYSVEVLDMQVNKTEIDLDFVLGAPLICDDELWGLAHQETDDSIIFAPFYTEDNPSPLPTDPVEHPISGSSPLSFTLNLVISSLCLNIYKTLA